MYKRSMFIALMILVVFCTYSMEEEAVFKPGREGELSDSLFGNQACILFADGNPYKLPESSMFKRQKTDSGAVVSAILSGSEYSELKRDIVCRKKAQKGAESVKGWVVECDCGNELTSQRKDWLRANLKKHCKCKHRESWEKYFEMVVSKIKDSAEPICKEAKEWSVECICRTKFASQKWSWLRGNLRRHWRHMHNGDLEKGFEEVAALIRDSKGRAHQKGGTWSVECDCGEKFTADKQALLMVGLIGHCKGKHGEIWEAFFEAAVVNIKRS